MTEDTKKTPLRATKTKAKKGNGMADPAEVAKALADDGAPAEDVAQLTQVNPTGSPVLTDAEQAVIRDMDQNILGMKVQLANVDVDIVALEEQRRQIATTVRQKSMEVQGKLEQMMKQRQLNPAIEWTFNFQKMQFEPKPQHA